MRKKILKVDRYSDMRIKFNGIVGNAKGGCIPCGKKAKSGKSFQTTKLYILPSGREILFRAGKWEEVTESEAEYLMRTNYIDGNEVKKVFEVG